ncbi:MULTISPECIES: MarR family winged helix-turn-helix transcriptional regulator [Eikenella]|uniref:DNA-binding protein n=1 Tax=Eikenella longinqua TaxID=1795827 RepID=A0A1A9S2U5_9NEIS|nr:MULTISPECIES: MarR family winged helix-turn-helix transcriptional regulator [Eikenella]OAM30845.1 DNA-binding protein [Eikenella longinqua]
MHSSELIGKHVSEIDAVFDDWITQLGLSYTHFAVLYSLAAVPEGQCTQKQICQEYFLPKQTVFNVCKEYREKGWIEFHPSTTDKRERIMLLTEAGRAQAEPVMARTNRMCDNAIAAFGKKKTEQMFALMSEFCQICRTEMGKPG